MGSISFAQLSAYLNANWLPIIAQIITGFTAFEDLTVLPGINNEVNIPKITTSEFLKPYTGTFEKTDAVALEDRKLRVDVGQGDLTFEPEAFRREYLGEQLRPGGRNIPEEQFIFDQLTERAQNTIDQHIVYFGKKEAVVAGDTAVQKARKITDGFGTIIAKEVTAGNLVPVVTGAITNANAISKVETVFKSLPTAVRAKGGVIYVSEDVYWKYFENYRTDYKTSPIFTGNELRSKEIVFMYAANWSIRPCIWMGNSQRIIASAGKNLYMGTDGTSPLTPFKLIDGHYHMEFSMKLIMGLQIADLDALAVNDQA